MNLQMCRGRDSYRFESTKLTDALHEVAGFETDYEFLTKRKMKEIQKLSKQSREKS